VSEIIEVVERGPKGDPGDAGAGVLSTAFDVDGVTPVITIPASQWGIATDGVPYFDPAGAVAAERAIMDLDADGVPNVRKVA
jgi:hypothetical protein